jgi:hypothetical protein
MQKRDHHCSAYKLGAGPTAMMLFKQSARRANEGLQFPVDPFDADRGKILLAHFNRDALPDLV